MHDAVGLVSDLGLSVVVKLRLAMYDRPYAGHRRRPQTNYALTSTRWEFYVVGFSKHNAKCACAYRGYSGQMYLDIVDVVNPELVKRNLRCFIVHFN